MLQLKTWPLSGEDGLTLIILCIVKYFCTGLGIYVSMSLKIFKSFLFGKYLARYFCTGFLNQLNL